MNCVVIGASGFIGSHLVDEIKSQHPHIQVTVVDDLRTPGNYQRDDVNYIIKSIQDPQTVMDLKMHYSFDTIFHLANTPRVRRAIEFPAETIDNNVTSTTAVCEIALEHGSHVFFSQSSSVQYDETQLNPYTLSKKFADQILTMYGMEYGVQVTNMYYYSVYGPREADYGPYSTVIRRFKQRLESKLPLEIFGNGSKKRDFTFVKDVVRNMMRMIEDEDVMSGKVIDVHFGRGKPVSIMDIAKTFDHPIIHKFDLPGEAQVTHCLTPYGDYECEVLDYITVWRKYSG